MTRKTLSVPNLLLGLVLLVLAACAQPGGIDALPPLAPSPIGHDRIETPELVHSAETPITGAQPTEPGEPEPLKLPAGQNISQDALASRARLDLANRLGLSIDQVQVISVLHTEFSAQAFFCQMAKERITRDAPPEIVEGQLIVLDVAGERYEYHANESNLVFCRQQNKFRP